SLFNPALQNVQQAVEKLLKALFIERGIKLKKSHSVSELKNLLLKNNIVINIADDECELLDSIYLPTKYPIGSALPDYSPDYEITEKCINITDRVFSEIMQKLSK
ncbi:MAG: HEPN domain-containing protein, partial [Chlorobi bacterium]|nr:HEPN domain-containing protein [Chlorobiota bacterium]